MGLLDDAIREHLELKRLHGASDEEISQEEAEALGPARRDFPAAPEEAQSAEVQSAEEESAVEDVVPAALEPDPAEPPAPEPEPEPEPEPDARPPASEAQEEAADASDDDVLEETPEFLQDAPEHDRLWFEQKPPRDFDFE
jgi:hypothetical protein